MFPISRDPPEGGTILKLTYSAVCIYCRFPISRDPPEGGTSVETSTTNLTFLVSNF